MLNTALPFNGIYYSMDFVIDIVYFKGHWMRTAQNIPLALTSQHFVQVVLKNLKLHYG